MDMECVDKDYVKKNKGWWLWVQLKHIIIHVQYHIINKIF